MAVVRSRRGLDLPLAGTPAGPVEDARATATVALLGADYPGLKPALKVDIGDRVALGQTLFEDKQSPGVRYTAPAGGTVSAIHRGARRALVSVVINVRCVDGADRIRRRGAGARTSRCRVGARAAPRSGPLAGTARAAIRARGLADGIAGGDLCHGDRHAPARDRTGQRDRRSRRGFRRAACSCWPRSAPSSSSASPKDIASLRRRALTSSNSPARTRAATPAGTSTGCCP